MIPTTTFEIANIIKVLPDKKSSGHDNVNNVLLKEVVHQILPIVENLFNDSLKLGIFPERMKVAEIAPLHKSKDTDIVDNYRPISLLFTVSKVLEKIVYKRVYKFLNDTGQIYDGQYGFSEKHLCDHVIGQLIGQIAKNHEIIKTTVATYLNLSKAFDTLTPSLVLDKMERYGIRGQTLAWFKSYLCNRKIRIKI